MCMIGDWVKKRPEEGKYLGWKVYELKLSGVLCSWAANYRYKSGKVVTRKPTSHPFEGFHVFRLKQDARELLPYTRCIIGKARLSGVVQEHEKGARGEKLEMLMLELPKKRAALAPKLRKRYGVRVRMV